MRVTTDFFVSALTRRVFSDGGFAAVLQRGATEAGAVFITMRTATGETVLVGPASQSSYDEAKPDDRRFALLLTADDDQVAARLEKERRFDSDIWVVEIEPSRLAIDQLVDLVKP